MTVEMASNAPPWAVTFCLSCQTTNGHQAWCPAMTGNEIGLLVMQMRWELAELRARIEVLERKK